MRPVRPDNRPTLPANLEQQLRSMLPLYDEFIENKGIPEEYFLDVPFEYQEQVHYSGAACARMVLKYLDRAPPSQDEIMEALGARDYRGLKHESFEISLSEVAAKYAQILPAHFSPAIHIAPKMQNGIAATDFIRSMPQVRYISDHADYIFKRVLVSRRAPIIVRIHFTTDLYPMGEEVARYLDVTGHALVIVGFNRDGFIVHDPWDASSFGGQRGGPNRKISYEELRDVTVMVNCSLKDEPSWDRLGLYVEHLQRAVFPERTIQGNVVLYWPGIEEVPADRWVITDVNAKFSTGSDIRFRSQNVNLTQFNLRPGQIRHIPFVIETGRTLGSHQIKVDVSARLRCCSFPWIENHVPTDLVIQESCNYRISVQSVSWFKSYAMSTPLPR